MSLDNLYNWPSWAHITEEETDELVRALYKATPHLCHVTWFAKAVFVLKPLPQTETPQLKLIEMGYPVSMSGLNNEQAHEKALVQWWALQGNVTLGRNTKEDKHLITLVDKWHRTMMMTRPNLQMREIAVHLKKYVDKHGLVDGAKAMIASPCIGKMEMVFLQPLATPELWNESQKYIKLFGTEDATTAPIA